mgnify:CR=1 FL=1
MQGIEARLARLREAIEGRAGPQTVFTCEDGTAFRAEREPLTYIHEHGSRTLDGRRIVGWKRPAGRHDPLSQSLIDLVDAAIERGGFPWSEV